MFQMHKEVQSQVYALAGTHGRLVGEIEALHGDVQIAQTQVKKL